jgi:hypothetical protein
MNFQQLIRNKRTYYVLLGVTAGAVIIYLVYKNRKLIASTTGKAVSKAKGYSKQFINYLGNIGQVLTSPRGVKNNNPGNINKTMKEGKEYLWKGEVPHVENTDKRFKQFYEWVYGVRALMLNLKSYFKSGKNTVRKIISTWAPESENKEGTEAYIKYVSSQLGVKPDSTLVENEKNLGLLTKAIAKFENGTKTEWVTDAHVKEAVNLL